MPEAAVVRVIVLVMCTVLKSGEVTIRDAELYDERFSPVVVPFWYIVIVWATPSDPSATSIVGKLNTSFLKLFYFFLLIYGISYKIFYYVLIPKNLYFLYYIHVLVDNGFLIFAIAQNHLFLH